MPEFLQNRKTTIIGAVVLAVFLLTALIFSLFLLRRVAPVTLNIWGLWEEPGVFSEVIADYQRKNPNVTVKYAKQSPLNYRDRLNAALAGNSGPDIFPLHNTWLPMFKNGLSPLPPEVYSPTAYKTTFYPVVSSDFISGGKAYAVPLEIDGLALYINQSVFNAGGVTVPEIWEDFRATAEKLTVRDSTGRIKTAGAAMGTASNVDHWQDIVSLMMLQAGVDLNTDPGSGKAADALTFYTSFATTEKIWDETLDNSTLAFASGKVGMYFGPSWRFFDFKAVNPNLNFEIVPVPQLTGGVTVNYASYWAQAVSKKSKNAKIAWDFLKFLSSKEELAKLYAAEAKLRVFGEPYSRTDMAGLLTTDSNAGPFISAAPTARSWYLASFTNDGETGINSRIGKYYQDAINSMLRGADAAPSLETVAKGVAQVLGSYGAK